MTISFAKGVPTAFWYHFYCLVGENVEIFYPKAGNKSSFYPLFYSSRLHLRKQMGNPQIFIIL